jgi:cell division protein FtsW (lipid II flippase)
LEIAAGTYDLFARLTCAGVSVGVALQALTNAAMAVGLLPITGMNFPLVSQGGSSLLATSLGVGLIVNIALRPPHSLAVQSRLLRL